MTNFATNNCKMNVVTDNNTQNLLVQGTTATVMGAYFDAAYIDMLPWFCAAIPLIIIDLRLGRKKARARGERVTIGKSIKMTLDKSLSYICWILLSVTLSIAFNFEYIKYFIMAAIYGIEVMSAVNSWYISRGLDINESEMLRLMFKGIYHRVTGIEEEFTKVFENKDEQELHN